MLGKAFCCLSAVTCVPLHLQLHIGKCGHCRHSAEAWPCVQVQDLYEAGNAELEQELAAKAALESQLARATAAVAELEALVASLQADKEALLEDLAQLADAAASVCTPCSLRPACGALYGLLSASAFLAYEKWQMQRLPGAARPHSTRQFLLVCV